MFNFTSGLRFFGSGNKNPVAVSGDPSLADQFRFPTSNYGLAPDLNFGSLGGNFDAYGSGSSLTFNTTQSNALPIILAGVAVGVGLYVLAKKK